MFLFFTTEYWLIIIIFFAEPISSNNQKKKFSFIFHSMHLYRTLLQVQYFKFFLRNSSTKKCMIFFVFRIRSQELFILV